MVAPRDPVDRIVDLLVAGPLCTYRAARRAAPLVGELVRRGISVGPPTDHHVAADVHDVDDQLIEDVIDEAVETVERVEAAATAPEPSVDDLAIDDYDHLAARQVVDRLGGLDHAELAAIREYELANRHRQTILRRIDQLRP